MAVAIKWFPPSWFQIRMKNLIIYIDPSYLRTYYTHYSQKIEFSKWPEVIDGLPENLEKADLILITHDHKDHAKDVTINRLRRKNTRLVGPRRCVKNLGKELQVVSPGDRFSFRGIQVRAVEAYNVENGNSTRKVHHKGNGVGYLVTAESKTIYHAGDTDFIPEMKELGPVDVALLPIGGTFTMDLEEAIRAAIAIKPGVVIPIHRNKADPMDFKIKIEALSRIKVVPLQIGEEYALV